jgi:cell division protein FtsI/penicillin-binding protein 2
VNRRRLLVVIAGLALGATGVVARSVQISVFEHGAWGKRALGQQQQVIDVPGPRGTIHTADGYVLATSIDRVAIQVNTRHLEYPEIFAAAVAPLLGQKEKDLARRLGGEPRSVWLAQRVRPELAEQVVTQVVTLAPHVVVLVPDFARIYPQGNLAAPVVGFVGREELHTVGRAGLEHHFDAYLAGEPEQYLAVNDAIQRKVQLQRLQRGRAGYDLKLTLLARLQARCEAVLARTLRTHKARAASAVVVDVRTGRVLALVSLPSFDPSNPGVAKTENWRLRPVQDAFEPGSTVKPFVAAAALAAEVIRPGERFDCLDRGVSVAGHWVRDHADPGRYTVDEVVVYSANAGIIEIAERLSEERLRHAFDTFGFGRRSGVIFPAEARGLLPETRTWSKMSRAGFALGQELIVSPLQMAMAYAAIGNGGWLLEPQLVMPDSESGAAADPGARTRIMDDALAHRLLDMLEGVVRDGTGELAGVPGYRTAGKTGTAQRAVGGSFDDQHHISWFAGLMPMPDPRIAVVVAVEDPTEIDYWASTVAAPIFSEIAEAAACLLDLAPTEAVPPPQERIAQGEAVAVGGNA